MKRILLVCSIIYPLSAHATPTRISTQECTAILDTLRNQVETIFLVEMTLAQFPRKAADVDGALRQVRDQLSDALAHYDSSVNRRGAHILGEKCLGNTDVSATDRWLSANSDLGSVSIAENRWCTTKTEAPDVGAFMTGENAMYDDRKLHSVVLGGFCHTQTMDGPVVGVRVHINTTSADGDGIGPGIEVELGIPASPDVSIREIRSQALERAHALVQRIARESRDDFRTALVKHSEFNFWRTWGGNDGS